MTDDDGMTPAQRELWEMLKGVRPAMMTTVDEDGSLRSRPMWTQGDTFDGNLWFFTADDAPKAHELARNPQIGLSYAAPDKDIFVSVSGRAEVVHDKAKIEELWNAFAEAWFPDGTADPHLALLKVEVDHAKYWQDKKPKILQLAEIAIGLVRDVPPKSGEQGRTSEAPGTQMPAERASIRPCCPAWGRPHARRTMNKPLTRAKSLV